MDEETIIRLINSALNIREHSYAPYSEFRVGAALLGESGRIYTGVNVENSSYPAGICAEQAAVCKAVSEGERSFKAIAIAGGNEVSGSESLKQFCYPCGICRQVLSEHCSEGFQVIVAKSIHEYLSYSLRDLLPFSFSL